MFSDVSKFESLSCKLEWKLYDLNKHEEFMPRKQFLTSKQFFNPKCPSVIWELRIYPKTSIHETHTFVSLIQVGLEIVNIIQTVRAKFSIYTLDDNGCKVYFCPSAAIDFKHRTESDLCEISTRNTSDNYLLLFCDVEFVPYNIDCEQTEVDKFINDKGSQNSFIDLLKQGTFADCVFEVENEKISAHRCVLAHKSIVFQKMFEQNGMIEAKNGEIKIIDCSLEVFKSMLEYIYSGKINEEILEKYSDDLFAIAHKYEVKQLMEICEHYMASNINISNFCERCIFAEMYGLTFLSKACVKFLSLNKKNFINSNEWNEFKLENKDLAFRLLESLSLIDEEKQKGTKRPHDGCSTCGNKRERINEPSQFGRQIVSRSEFCNDSPYLTRGQFC